MQVFHFSKIYGPRKEDLKALQDFSLCLFCPVIVLANDIEINPGYQTFTRGLKLANLNIRSLANKTDSLHLEGITNKTFDMLTLSKTWLNSSTSDAEIKLPGFVCTRLDHTGKKEGYGRVAMYV